MIVRGAKTRPPSGRDTPTAAVAARSSTARAAPSTSPMVAPTNPTIPASSWTASCTCRLLAPSARSRASSRTRWATSIVKVLKMMKAPTKTAMPAKTRRNVEKPPMACWTVLAFSSVSCFPVTASTPVGSIRAIRSRSSLWEMPSAAAMLIDVYWPGASSTRCAVAVSNTVTAAPPRLSCPAIRNVPTRV